MKPPHSQRLFFRQLFLNMTESSQPTTSIVVVGGGSAGWLTAGLIAGEHRHNPSVAVTLVESPNVATIGVGEGTWPTMRTTLHRIGISEDVFLRECAGSYKQGTRFVGWVTGDEGDVYYHPFSPPAGYPGLSTSACWLTEERHASFADSVTPQARVCDRNLAPKQAETPEYAHVLNYGYHLDAGRFATLLQQHCTGELGVRHVLDHVTGVVGSRDEDIRGIRTENSGVLEGDLFIDCTGFKCLLLGEHYGVGFRNMNHILFNDTALAVQVPYEEESSPVASQTISTATLAGWIWDIGLPTRRGVGYVFSSRHSTDDEAAAVLASYLRLTVEPRKISFTSGYRESFWHRNCVAVGMSSGFLEPLEASALVMIELSARFIADELPANRQAMAITADRFNELFTYRWERIIEFLKLHYVLSRRDDAGYWRDNRDPVSIPDRLSALLELWRYNVPSKHDFPHVDEIFSAASYQYVLYGMGFNTTPRVTSSLMRERQNLQKVLREMNSQCSKLLQHLPDNRTLLNRVQTRGCTCPRYGTPL